MGCISSTPAANVNGIGDGQDPPGKARKLARRLTVNGPLGLDLEGSTYAVSSSSKKIKSTTNKKYIQDRNGKVNYGDIDKDGVQPSGGTKAIGSLPFLYGTCSRCGKKPSKRRKQNQDCFAVIDVSKNIIYITPCCMQNVYAYSSSANLT